MPQPPFAPRPTPTRPTPNRPTPTPPAVAEEEPRKGIDLTVNKVLAGSGAAATSAVLGSYFGATGTVIGAAFGSLVSTVASTLYQRSLDTTRDRLVRRIRPADEGGASTMPMPRLPLDAETVRLRVEPTAPPRRRFRYAVVALVAFAVGLLAVTGAEWIKGSTLVTGQAGTSVGRVITGNGQNEQQQQSNDQQDQQQRHDQQDWNDNNPDPSNDPTTSPATPSDKPDPSSTNTPSTPLQDRRGGGGLGGLLPSLGSPSTGSG
ncbi:hypothetical protein [Pseudonocardia sp. GCM10023141]|uniref:hypothetical protein n=1 Tax=Pseudonocardia sp. GCM10023141 TaxID=3252653 RepID=UPI003617A886